MLTALFCLPWTSNAYAEQLNEGFNSTTFPPADWTNIHVSGASVSWARYTPNKQEGTASASVNYGASGKTTINYLITPRLMPKEGEQLSFYLSSQTYSGTTLTIEVSETGNEQGDFTNVLATYTSNGTLGSTNLQTFVNKQVDLSAYVGKKIYIAFHVVDNYGSRICLDNVTGVSLAPAATCIKPESLNPTSINSSSATFVWSEGASESSWQYICLPAGNVVDWSDANVKATSSKTVTVSNLLAQTDYKFYIRSDCGTEQSDAVSKAFTTSCAGYPTADLPFEQNFDAVTTGTIPSCWSKFASGDYPYVYTGGVSGNCMYTYGGGSTSVSTIILPPFEAPTNTLVISFSYKNTYATASYGQAKIGYVTNLGDVSSFVALAGGSLTRETEWTEVKKFALTGAPANSYIAIQLSGGSTAYQRLYIDDIKVALPSSCTDPSEVSAVAASATSATVSWTENGSAEAWNIQYSTDNFATHTDVNNVTTNPYTLTGLSGNTTYKVRVQANCGGEQSDFVVSDAFTTPCESVDGIGYSTGFESPTYTYSSYALPDCWQKIASQNYPYIYNYYKRSGSQCLYFYGGASASSQIAILPPFNENTSSLSVSLYYNNASDWDDYTGVNYGQLSVGYITNPADASTFTAVATLDKVNTYTLAKVPMIGAPDNSYIAIRYSGGTSNGGAFVDDLEISEVSSCLEPSGVTGLASTPNTASISWTENGSATAWKIRYSSDAGAHWSDEIAANTNPFVLTGLTGSSNYIVQVKAICGSEETSDWSVSSQSFPTPCEAIASITDFSFEISEGCTVGGPMPNCWSKLPSAGTYPNIYNYYSKVGSNCLRFYGNAEQYAVLPQFTQEVKNLSISFWYRNYYEGVLEVGSMIDPADASTFKSLATETTISDYGTAITKVNLSGADDGAYYIAFKHSGTNTYDATYIDLVSVFTTPTCVEPTGVSASDVTATNAVIAWTAGGSETAWKLQYSTDGSNWTDANGGANVTNPYTLTGLSASTTYYARVKAVCSVSDESEWSAASASFKTACAVATLPFSDNFGGADLGCWEMNSCYASTGLYSGAFRFYYSTNPPQYLISPELDTDGKPVTVEFDYKVESSTYSETFSVGYSSTTNEISAFTWGAETAYTNTDYQTYSENLPVGVKYVAIKYTSYDKYYLYIDNFSVAEYVAPACPNVVASTLAASDVTANSATVAWTAANEETAWNLQYKADGGEWSDAIAVSTTPSYDLTGLAANTLYYVKVQANCGGDGTSEYTGDAAFSFRTDCETIAISKASPWNYGFEVSDGVEVNTIPSCWAELPEGHDNYTYALVANYNQKTGDQCLEMEAYSKDTKIAVLPVFSEEIKNLQIAFAYNNTTNSNYGHLELGYVKDDAFTRVGDLYALTENYVSVTAVEMPADAPNGARIAFRLVGIKSYYYSLAYIDDIQVSVKPSCYTPKDLIAVATSTGAALSWTAGKDEAAWQVRYKATADADWTLVDAEIASPAYDLTGLTVDVEYEAQVRAYCDELDQSEWTASVNFTPECGAAPNNLAVSARSTNAATLTWESAESAFKLQTSLNGENWDEAIDVSAKTYNLTGLAAGTTYYVRVQNNCGGDYATVSFTTWCDVKDAAELPLNINSFTAVPECWEINFVGEYSGIANNRIFFYGEAEQMAVLPAYDIAMNKLSVTFGYYTNNASLEFGYIDEPNGTFHAFATQPTSGESLSLAAEVAETKYIAVRYIGSSQYASAYLSSVYVAEQLTLPETGNSTDALEANNGQTLDVQINRTFYADGYFNTVCLPFSLPTLDGTPLEGGKLLAFKYGYVENGELLLRVYPTDAIEAGVPYLISWTAGENIVNPIFTSVTIAASAGKSVGENNDVQFVGIFAPETFQKDDKTKLFMLANNQIAWSGIEESGHSLKSFRAYFQTNTPVSSAPIRHGMPARIVMGEQIATGCENIQGGQVQSLKVLENNQVVIIRNGVKYNLQGQKIQ